MARQQINPIQNIRYATEIGIGAALLAGVLTHYVVSISDDASIQITVIVGFGFFLFWLIRPFVGWLLGMPQPPRVPRWWARRNTGVAISVVWGIAVVILARYGWQWDAAGSVEIGISNGLGLFAIWLMKPFTIWVSDLIMAGFRRIRARPPKLPSIKWQLPSTATGNVKDTRSLDEEHELLALTPREFEELCAAIARSWGYKAQAVGESGDGGIDVQMWKGDEYVIGQCKRYVGTVPIGHVRDFYGAMVYNGVKRGYFFTTGRFSSGTYEFVKKINIELLDGMDIVRAVKQHNVKLKVNS